ncbi:hypothetical protein TVAG_255260 [Trichomonas vaginalis G3]|uniref:Uncharacterized protein n=1 Tax=Trichomonas vaginalis (strain ATCC PRA-98 / G3) TaxID=412133 RepID=A2FPY6_TRIV3|nr:protein of unknown function, DUF4106 family [Trichomonas vaginalis G3]EAX93045.1 hypothetical protein TVAG_255260 [Trichomonas vaginalis G3]KAI5543790.1 protein of unknown function, DUF4106 family [Trichomonas vaginalis G3]|eukprot:XP_001305975.1 hypothetical protein [Trichomonas vaginalis G3]
MIQCNTESLEGSPFSRLRLPSWLSDTGWSGVWLPLQLLPRRSNDYTKVMAMHSNTINTIAVAYNCECLLLQQRFAADTRNVNQNSPES